MKKYSLKCFNFTKLTFFIVSKLSQCITAFHDCGIVVSYGFSPVLVPEIIYWAVVCGLLSSVFSCPHKRWTSLLESSMDNSFL